MLKRFILIQRIKCSKLMCYKDLFLINCLSYNLFMNAMYFGSSSTDKFQLSVPYSDFCQLYIYIGHYMIEHLTCHHHISYFDYQQMLALHFFLFSINPHNGIENHTNHVCITKTSKILSVASVVLT